MYTQSWHREAKLLLPKKNKPSLLNMCFKITWNTSWIQFQLPLQVFPLLQCKLCPRRTKGVFLFLFFLLKKKPTLEMAISSYTKSVCFVHIVRLLSFNSNANCQKRRYQTCSHFPCSGKEKRERSANCMQAFSNVPALSVPSLSDGCFTIGNMSNCPSCVVLSHQLLKSSPDSGEKEDRTVSTLSPQGMLWFSVRQVHLLRYRSRHHF